MTLYDAKKYGGQKAIKATFFLFILLELIFMFQETNGDFANGILFFIEKQANIYLIFFIILCFASNYLLGRLAGNMIIFRNKNYWTVSFLLGVTFTFLVVIYHIMVVALLMKVEHVLNPFFSYSYFFNQLFKEFLVLIIPCVLCWALISSQIHKKVATS